LRRDVRGYFKFADGIARVHACILQVNVASNVAESVITAAAGVQGPSVAARGRSRQSRQVLADLQIGRMGALQDRTKAGRMPALPLKTQ
jgi:hypothetical protein